MKLLAEALKEAGAFPKEKVTAPVVNEEDLSDDEIDSIMNKSAEKKFGKDSKQAKLHKKFGKKKDPKAQDAEKQASDDAAK